MLTRTPGVSRIAYFDCINGAAGDMIVAALLDAGASLEALRSGIASLPVDGYSLEVSQVQKQGLAAKRFIVKLDPSRPQPHRHLKHVAAIIQSGKLPAGVQATAIAIFENLADAEAAVHGTTEDKVHFHEVGAVDAIIDVVGACILLADLRVSTMHCSPIPVGSGTTEAAHGVLPVPAPATTHLLRGVPLAATDETGELTTPTSEAILKTLASSFGSMPSMVPAQIGYGAGTRDGHRRPNVMRVVVGTPVSSTPGDFDQVVQIETNLDHVSPETIGYCMDRLLQAGALDVFSTPIQMKKWRPGVLLTVLCTPVAADDLAEIIFAETGTLGVRRSTLSRSVASRRIEPVATDFGEIRMKVSRVAGQASAAPEFEDCKSAAIKFGVPLRVVQTAAKIAWQASQPGPGER